MLDPWLRDIEALEAISQDSQTRRIFLRMAALSQTGRLPSFLDELARDRELDEDTKENVAELAQDPTFLFAVEEYLRRTRLVH